MSDSLFTTRLWWAAGRGAAKLHGRRVVLTQPPVLLGLQCEQLDYCPEAGTREIQPERCARREMTRNEVWACDALLLALCPPGGLPG